MCSCSRLQLRQEVAAERPGRGRRLSILVAGVKALPLTIDGLDGAQVPDNSMKFQASKAKIFRASPSLLRAGVLTCGQEERTSLQTLQTVQMIGVQMIGSASRFNVETANRAPRVGRLPISAPKRRT